MSPTDIVASVIFFVIGYYVVKGLPVCSPAVDVNSIGELNRIKSTSYDHEMRDYGGDDSTIHKASTYIHDGSNFINVDSVKS